jgi:moderate conductance mechanosensitive channel
MYLLLANLIVGPEAQHLRELLLDWREDSITFLRVKMPKIVVVIVASIIVLRIFHSITHQMASIRTRRLPSGFRAQQIQTISTVLNSVANFAVIFTATLMVLSILEMHIEPLLASAGIAGLAIGFGAQTLVHDFINGFFVLLEDQYNIGDTIRIAGVKGVVEDMTLRRTVLRDDDGTVHIIPNSQIQVVSNMTRDWAQLALRVAVAYSEPSDKVISLLKQVGDEIRNDPAFAEDIVGDVQVPGIDRVGNGEVDYLVLVKTRPNKQYAVSREFRRRIKEYFEKNNIQAGLPGRIFVKDSSAGSG